MDNAEAIKAKRAAYAREWYAAHKEQHAASQRKYREANKEKLKQIHKDYYQRNKDRYRANAARYRETMKARNQAAKAPDYQPEPKETKCYAVAFYMRPSLHAQIKALANAQGIAVNTLIHNVLEDYVKENQ